MSAYSTNVSKREIMDVLVIIGILCAVFFCEYVNSSCGMGYGTILTPILIIAGFHPLLVIPSVLLSQGVSSLSATFFHVKYKNIRLDLKSKDTPIMFTILGIGIIAIFPAASLSIQLPQTYLETYISIIVVIMGVILLGLRKISYSRKKLFVCGIFSVFNKAFTGTGFGPVFTPGQIISGKTVRNSIGTTIAIETPICICAFIAYVLFTGYMDYQLPILLCIGALLATPFGPYRTMKLKEINGRTIIGILCVALGLFMVVKNFIGPYISEFVVNPFFWAFISMFALIGSSVTLVSRQLRQYRELNMAFIGIFALGRFLLVLPFQSQPCIDCGRDVFACFSNACPICVIGLIIFITGLIFLTSLFRIKPFPAMHDEITLVTTGFYRIVRNPIYLGEILWCLGWAIMFHSIIGIAIVPLWWAGLLFHVMIEEEYLERILGQRYLDYKARVRGRIFPGLPI